VAAAATDADEPDTEAAAATAGSLQFDVRVNAKLGGSMYYI
jgi:hypothetical protein